MKSKIIILFNGRFPSEKAASLFVAKSAEAFADMRLPVLVMVPKRKVVISEKISSFYGVRSNFEVVYIKTIDLFNVFGNRVAFWLGMISFSINSFFYINKYSTREDVIYSNEILPLFLISFLRPNCFYEMHDFPESKLTFFEIFLNRMHWILIHNKWKLNEVSVKFPEVNKNKFIFEPNAVNIRDFDLNITTSEARKKVGLPQDKKIALYTGHLYTWKGVDTLAQAAELLKEDHLVVFVGGTVQDVADFTKKYGQSKKIKIIGHKHHSEIPLWQKSSDVLVLPNTAKEAISAYYTSPMKLFEYMASKKPIIASDIPSIREIVDEKSAVFVAPDDVSALVRAITDTISLKGESFSSESFRRVESHTWEKRAQRIISFIRNNKHQFVSYKPKILLFCRYIFSGSLAFFSNMFLLFLFKHYLDWHYLAASTTSFTISVVVSFLAQKFITFKDKSKDQVKGQLFKYILIALFNILANVVFMFSFVDLMHISYVLSQVFSAAIIAFYSLFLYRLIIFSHVKIL